MSGPSTSTPEAKEALREFGRALSLLTRLPVRVAWDARMPWGRLAGWFPAVGLVIGAILVGIVLLWNRIAHPALLPAVVLAAWAGLTGALHLDGFTDCCDAFFTPVTRERRLAIMADPRTGAFGVIGVALLLLVKYAAVASLLLGPGLARGLEGQLRALWPLIVAPVAARAVMVGILALPDMPLAKPGGMGARVREGLGNGQLIAAAVTALLAAASGGHRGFAMLGAALLAGLGTALLAKNRIGGLTGDVLGASVEMAETAALAVLTLKAFS